MINGAIVNDYSDQRKLFFAVNCAQLRYGLTFGDYLFSKDITTKLTGYHDFMISEVPNYG